MLLVLFQNVFQVLHHGVSVYPVKCFAHIPQQEMAFTLYPGVVIAFSVISLMVRTCSDVPLPDL